MEEKANVFLDLDQTLIFGEEATKFDYAKNKDAAKKFRFHNMDGFYIIFERPGVQDFLTFLFDNFNVSVWTAASKDYALFVIDKVVLAGNSNRKLNYIFFSYHCKISEIKTDRQKYLKLLWDTFNLKGYNKNNTIIIDDYKDEVYKAQPHNCILAPVFEFKKGSENDTFLKELKEKLRELAEAVKKGDSVKNAVDSINKNNKN